MSINSQPAWRAADGRSALYCGDGPALMAGMPPDSVDCIWTDPPYMLSNDGFTCVAGRRVSVNKGAWDRSAGIERDHEFNLAWLRECHRVLKPAGAIWVSGTHHLYLSAGYAMTRLGFAIVSDIIWEKSAPPPNLGCRCFTHATETLLYAVKDPGERERRLARLVDSGPGKVWRLPAAGPAEKKFGKHPTQKPLALVARCLRASANPGDLVLDPFAGAATAGCAAIALGRRFIGMELEPEYVDIGVRRLTAAAAATDAL